MNSTSKSHLTGDTSESERPMVGTSSSTSGSSCTPKRYNTLTALISAIDALRDGCGDPTVSAHVVVGFLELAKNPKGLSVSELEGKIGISQASAYRAVQLMGKGTPNGKTKGAYLIQEQPDPLNWSRKILTLSPKGERVLEQVEEKLFKHLGG